MSGQRPGRGSLWDSDLVAGVAFHPRRCQPSSRSPPGGAGWVDSDFPAHDGTRLACRLYLAPSQTSEEEPPCALAYFHANAELCTDLEQDVARFFDCGFRVVACPEYRGFAWSEGRPSLRQLLPDAECFLDALPGLLRERGIPSPGAGACRLVVHGRSLGSTCAVHLAACRKDAVAALVVESGVMSLVDLPMVQQLGAMMPAMLQALLAEPDPLCTLADMKRVEVPTVIIHGERDEMSPVEQAVMAHQACGSTAKKLVRYPRCHHNDVRLIAQKEYYSELRTVCQVASGKSAELLAPDPPPPAGLLGMLTGALQCFPGMRRCLANADSGTGQH